MALLINEMNKLTPLPLNYKTDHIKRDEINATLTCLNLIAKKILMPELKEIKDVDETTKNSLAEVTKFVPILLNDQHDQLRLFRRINKSDNPKIVDCAIQ